MHHLRLKGETEGLSRIVKCGDCGMKLTGFSLLQLRQGQTHSANTGKMEVALVILGGRCSVKGDGFSHDDLGWRENVFAGLPSTVYLPADTSYEVQAITDVDVAMAESPSTLAGQTAVILPEQVRTMSIGKDNFTREARFIIDEKFPSEHFYIGEAIVPSGNWASYPPHRHDFDRLPEEVDMEEIYFFRFNPQQGFGIQSVYTDSRDVDAACILRENDTVAIPRGYHPVVNAPGYVMYYLWIMTGSNRAFLSHKDSDHEWVA